MPHSRSRGPLPPSTAGSTEAPVLRSLVRLQGHLTSPPVTLLVSRTCPHIQPLPSARPPESRVRVAACSWVLPPQPPHDRGTPPPPPPRVGPVPRCVLAGRAPAARGHGTANTRGRHQGTLLPAARPVPGIAVDPVAGCRGKRERGRAGRLRREDGRRGKGRVPRFPGLVASAPSLTEAPAAEASACGSHAGPGPCSEEAGAGSAIGAPLATGLVGTPGNEQGEKGLWSHQVLSPVRSRTSLGKPCGPAEAALSWR